jgi:hypothetical protein
VSVILIEFPSNAERNRRLNPVRRNQKCCIVLKQTAFVHHLDGAGILNICSGSKRVKGANRKALRITQQIRKVVPTRSCRLLAGTTDLLSFLPSFQRESK